MAGKPIYINTFSRDFTLITVEVWGRAEALDYLEWSRNRFSGPPFFVIERSEGIESGYYNPEGILWMKKELINHAREDNNFLSNLKEITFQKFSEIEPTYKKRRALGREDFLKFLIQYEQAWIWFDAIFWLWETTDNELEGVFLPKGFREMRDVTQNFVPDCEAVTRESLKLLYPELGKFQEVLRIEEITKNDIPPIKELEKRFRGYFWVEGEFYTGVKRNFIEKKFGIQFEKLDFFSENEFIGTIAQKGIGRGIVKKVYGFREIEKIKDGDILISTMTLPDFLPAMKKSSAIVTDEGGISCHAAIIARELKKPCIIGTKIATKVLKDGDLVEVDADKGIVKILKRA